MNRNELHFCLYENETVFHSVHMMELTSCELHLHSLHWLFNSKTFWHFNVVLQPTFRTLTFAFLNVVCTTRLVTVKWLTTRSTFHVNSTTSGFTSSSKTFFAFFLKSSKHPFALFSAQSSYHLASRFRCSGLLKCLSHATELLKFLSQIPQRTNPFTICSCPFCFACTSRTFERCI